MHKVSHSTLCCFFLYQLGDKISKGDKALILGEVGMSVQQPFKIVHLLGHFVENLKCVASAIMLQTPTLRNCGFYTISNIVGLSINIKKLCFVCPSFLTAVDTLLSSKRSSEEAMPKKTGEQIVGLTMLWNTNL